MLVRNLKNNVIEQCRKIVEQQQATEIDGYIVDMQTANCIVQFYDQLALRKSGLRWQRKMLSFPMEEIAWFAWNAVS